MHLGADNELYDIVDEDNDKEWADSLVEKLSFMTILCQFRRVIPNICVNLDASFQTFMLHWTIFLSHWTFLVILDSVTTDHVSTSDWEEFAT